MSAKAAICVHAGDMPAIRRAEQVSAARNSFEAPPLRLERGCQLPDRSQTPRARAPLEALNFFMADMQAGIGPFLGVFLQQHGWATGAIGAVMSLGGVAEVACAAPAGALMDASSRKRIWIIASGLMTVLASGLIFVSQRFWVVAASRVATAIAGFALLLRPACAAPAAA